MALIRLFQGDYLVPIGLEAPGNVFDRLAVIQQNQGFLTDFKVFKRQLGFDKIGGATYTAKIYGLHIALSFHAGMPTWVAIICGAMVSATMYSGNCVRR